MPGVTELLSANQQEGKDKITPPPIPQIRVNFALITFWLFKEKKSIGWGWGSGLGHFYKVYIGAT